MIPSLLVAIISSSAVSAMIVAWLDRTRRVAEIKQIEASTAQTFIESSDLLVKNVNARLQAVEDENRCLRREVTKLRVELARLSGLLTDQGVAHVLFTPEDIAGEGV